LGKTLKFPANTKLTSAPPIHINWTYPGTRNKDGRTEITNKLTPNQDNNQEPLHDKEATRQQPVALGV